MINLPFGKNERNEALIMNNERYPSAWSLHFISAGLYYLLFSVHYESIYNGFYLLLQLIIILPSTTRITLDIYYDPRTVLILFALWSIIIVAMFLDWDAANNIGQRSRNISRRSRNNAHLSPLAKYRLAGWQQITISYSQLTTLATFFFLFDIWISREGIMEALTSPLRSWSPADISFVITIPLAVITTGLTIYLRRGLGRCYLSGPVQWLGLVTILRWLMRQPTYSMWMGRTPIAYYPPHPLTVLSTLVLTFMICHLLLTERERLIHPSSIRCRWIYQRGDKQGQQCPTSANISMGFCLGHSFQRRIRNAQPLNLLQNI